MRRIIFYQILLFILWASCKSEEKTPVLPDLRPNFTELLKRKDSVLQLDSFYLVGMDTINEKKTLIHERFPFLSLMNRLNNQLDNAHKGIDSFHSAPSASDLDTINYLISEKTYVGKVIDSLNLKIAIADSVIPTGYRAFYKVTVRKENAFIISDTITYSISLKMNISEWDRNIQKKIDSLSIGRHSRSEGLRRE